MKKIIPFLVCLIFGTQALAVTIQDDQNSTITSTTSGAKQALDVNIAATSGGAPAPSGAVSVNLARNVYSSVNVTTAAYVQLLASTSDTVNGLFVFDSSGQTLVLATGAAASEVDKLYIAPGGNGWVPLAIPSGTRVSLKAVSANATVGEISVSFLK